MSMQIELSLKQSLQLSPQMLQSMEVLQMGALELNQYIRELVQENPTAELQEPTRSTEQEEQQWQRLQSLAEYDRQNSQYLAMDRDQLDPLARVGTDGGLGDTLLRHLTRQIDRTDAPEAIKSAARYLAACLDDNGYLRDSPEELSRDGNVSRPLLEAALALLQTLEPAGVGAQSLSQCLLLQLDRLGEEGPAAAVAAHHLEQLAKKQYHAISLALGIPQAEVLRAERTIQSLNPRPGAGFAESEKAACYLIPDLVVSEDENGLTVSLQDAFLPSLRVSGYYCDLHRDTQDREVRQYLTEKLRQAQWAVKAVEQRRSTLLRCAQAIVAHQAAFFRPGGHLVPMCLADIAQKLDIHESTVSRAVREKYLECPHGVYPLSFFFSRTAGGEDVSVHQVKELLNRLIREEDPAHPLSDQKLTLLLEEQGLAIARRTVAKYRTELGFSSAAGRRKAPF